ncbi:MAG: hypothetical protein ABFS35_21010, partial [Bacteroidota bacterium]
MIKLLKSLLIILLVFFSVVLNAQEISKPQENKDSTVLKDLKTRTTSSISEFQNLYSLESELEHQKLLRNIFAVSFIFLFATLMFIIFFYGSRVKKI